VVAEPLQEPPIWSRLGPGMNEYRWCFRCGRGGTRGFIEFGSSWLCAAEAPCDRRRRAWLKSFKRPRRRKAAA